MNCNAPYATRSKKRNAVANPYATRSKKRDAVANPYMTRFQKRKAAANPLPRVETTLLDLPYHIITDILVRLPAECVFRCQLASKFLEILVRTPFFIRTHLARPTTPIIALQSFTQSSERDMKFYFTDEQAKKVEEANLKLDLHYMQKDDPVMLYNSYDGFFLLKNSKNYGSRSIFIIWNPITEEQATVTTEGYYFHVCGFYFNPHNKEYEVILHHWVYRDGNSGRYAFDILSVGSKSRRNIGKFPYVPKSESPPTIINGTLYWIVGNIVEEINCSNSIMAFEIRTKKFCTMPHGGAFCDYPCLHPYKMHLIEMEGKLGLCVVSSSDPNKLVLWVLNRETNSWAKTHTVTLAKCSTPKYLSYWPNTSEVEVLLKKDGKLLIRHNHRVLLWDLDSNTGKIVKKRGFEDDNFRPVVHTQSLVSLDTDKLIQLDSSRG
ncbi:putative F-box protein At1g46984 [Papaver somniferum]|uniref:putative F-box protein At1g46984 n=1 Tax=Papaver somniferum TaxID=3469 RepID=UPI000E704D25|nr:putative F-box protein At1g46984 [Papaver somniferum]